jgi:hypothetical protein
MRIDGAVGAPIERVVLDEFFDRPAHVDVRIISPYGRAMVREILMESFEVGDVDTKGKVSDVKTKPQGQADRDMRVRDVKLRHAFAGTDIMADGQAVPWDKELWNALDEADPRILTKVLEAIDRINGGEAADPT